MRLRQIKLSGFKSFAEPTTFSLPGQRVGVVGPNGCGKSNIIDAVRWVLGESKASELRGESMQDVIFSGSGTRKPAARASVELVFDNTLARAGGAWNSFTEIAVRRVLTRDGTSSYAINQQSVRRRDVQDVFLGTGLGPRAYAIIGQGTISRIIESRPEELRLFLEEAAGVSKYKERRRETESRLKDTRENLVRVDDILRELNASLERLEAQAEVAGRYRDLQALATRRQHELWFLKARDAAGEEARVNQARLAASETLEARVAELRRAEAELEQIRQAHYAAGDELHRRQGALAETGAEVSRLEERIRYVLDGRERVARRRSELEGQNAQWQARIADAEAETGRLAEAVAAAQARACTLATAAEAAAQALPALLEAHRRAVLAAQEGRLAVGEVQQQIRVLAAESRSLEEQRRQVEARREKLGAERRQIAPPDEARVASLAAQHATLATAHEAAEERLAALAQQVPQFEAARREAQQAAQAEAARLAQLTARLAALRALQEKVQTEGKVKPWLAKHGLSALAGLWQRLHVEPGWEPALEAALRERIGALEVGRLDTVRAFAADPPPSRLAFFSMPGGAAPPAARPGLVPLTSRLRVADAALVALLSDWLEGLHCAGSIDEAFAMREQLVQGEVMLTREGHAVSRHAVAFYAPDSEQAGLLARAQEIENLEREQRAAALIEGEARAAAVRAEAAASEAALRLASTRREAAEAQTRAHQAQLTAVRATQEAAAAAQRSQQLQGELGELDAQSVSLQSRLDEAQARFDALDTELGAAQEHHAGLEDAVSAAEEALNAGRERQRGAERDMQEVNFELRGHAQRTAELERAVETARAQIARNSEAGEQLQLELGSLDDAAAQAGLQAALVERLAREEALALARRAHDDLAARLRAKDEQRLVVERQLDPLREKLGRLQLEAQAAMLGGAQYREQLAAAHADLEAVEAGIAREGVKLAGLAAEIEGLQREIESLGAVNLAALEELTAGRERKTFLDAQNADLNEAMRTLEDAIRTIDAETRELLASTFRDVNEHFGRMFPQLFGGGTARLVMTGEEILDAGVQVMAQPPGKKNQTIHLLSGGEKALTAIALVFAIFQLNPAPFCLLDEVDAPLDDSNTERYCRLVSQMSQATQFLFISHNKIAMEMAEQLIGVTMPEQGVSRIVAVDIEGAASLAEAA
jgi:chromosome segregation protein